MQPYKNYSHIGVEGQVEAAQMSKGVKKGREKRDDGKKLQGCMENQAVSCTGM